MKMKSIFVIAIVMLFTIQGFAAEGLTVAFDQSEQRMQTIFWSDDPVHVVIAYAYGGTCGPIQGYGDGSWVDNGGAAENTTIFWCSATLEPTGLIDGDTMTFTATATIYELDWTERGMIDASDDLIVDAPPGAEDPQYGYGTQECPGFWLPPIIDIGESYCATICHGSWMIPIYCEADGYTPELMQITIQNRCNDQTTCDSDPSCNGLAEWDLNFQYQVLVGPNCPILFLQISYCGTDEGCICITRGNFFLPVEMGDFAAIAGDNEVTLNWNTESERDHDYFEILRDGNLVGRVDGEGSDASGHAYSWVDRDVVNGTTYTYSLAVVDVNGTREVLNVEDNATPNVGLATPTSYNLSQNFPNPFNSETSFTFSIMDAQHVTLKIYDLLGREAATVLDRSMEANTHTVTWSASDLAAGVYMYTLTAGEFSQTKKMLYLK